MVNTETASLDASCALGNEIPYALFAIKKFNMKNKQPHINILSSVISVLSRNNSPAWNILTEMGTVLLHPGTRHHKEVKHFI